MKTKRAILLLIILSCISTNVFSDIELKFGLYLSDKPSELKRKFTPILTAIEKSMSAELGEPVKINISLSKGYEGGVTAISSGAVDFARVGPASYVEAIEKNADISILAIEQNKGKKTFNGIIAIHKDSPIKMVSELKGKSFAFGNKYSTIGRYLSQSYLLSNGIKASDLSSYKYLGSHKKTGDAVARKKYDAGALKESTFKKMINRGIPIKMLVKFSNVTKPWVARSGLSIKIKTAITNALLAITDKKILKAIKKDGFLTGSKDDYVDIMNSIAENNKFFNL